MIIRAVNALAKACFFLACLAFVFMSVHIFLDVLLRRFGIYIEGTLEFTSFYYMTFAVFLSFAYTQMKDAHISTDLAFNFFPKKVQWYVMKLGFFIQAVLYALFTYLSMIEAISATEYLEEAMANFTFYVWPAKWALPLGFLALTLVAILQLFCDYKKLLGDKENTHV